MRLATSDLLYRFMRAKIVQSPFFYLIFKRILGRLHRVCWLQLIGPDEPFDSGLSKKGRCLFKTQICSPSSIPAWFWRICWCGSLSTLSFSQSDFDIFVQLTQFLSSSKSNRTFAAGKQFLLEYPQLLVSADYFSAFDDVILGSELSFLSRRISVFICVWALSLQILKFFS